MSLANPLADLIFIPLNIYSILRLLINNKILLIVIINALHILRLFL